MKWKPHQYQIEAMRFLLERGSAGLFAFPGSGKTSVTLQSFSVLKEQGLARRALVVAPFRVCDLVWPPEIEKWDDFHGLTFGFLHGKDKKEILHSNTDLCMINPEGLRWLLQPENFYRGGFDTLIVDELSKFKHPNTQRFKFLKPVLGTFRRRWGLTGSPSSNGLMDLFGEMYILDQGRSLGKYITHYRNQYFTPDFMGYKWELRPGADKLIYERIAPLVMVLEAGDSGLDLPELVENRIYVDLPLDAMRAYRLMEKVLVTMVNNEKITAANAAAASSKCRQIASGAVHLNPEFGERGGWELVHNAKIEALEDLISELQGSPLLVAYEFTHDMERIQKVLGGGIPYVGGGVSPKVGVDIVNRWNAGKIPVLLAQSDTAAHGLNLQSAGHHLCWFSPTWNYETYDQFIRRIWRQGQKSERVVVHHIIARGTIDEAIYNALSRKEQVQNSLLEALKNLRCSEGDSYAKA